jgi:hypothetical protein
MDQIGYIQKYHPITTGILIIKTRTYLVSYTPKSLGDYKIEVLSMPELIDIVKSPFNVKCTKPLDPVNTICDGPGIKEGNIENKETKFKIYPKDKDGKMRPKNSDDLSILVDGPSEVIPVVKACEDGTYDVSYTPKAEGRYSISLLHDKKEMKLYLVKIDPSKEKIIPKEIVVEKIIDEPNEFDILIEQLRNKKKEKIPNGVDPFKTEVLGDGLVDGPPNMIKTIKIISKDKDGNIRDLNDDIFDIQIDGPIKTPVTLTSNNEYEYIPKTIGDYKIKISNNGNELKDSPYSVNITPQLSPNKSYLKQKGINRIGHPCNVQVELNDEFGNQIKYKPKKIMARLLDCDEVEIIPTITMKDNKYNVCFLPIKEGSYTVSLEVDDEKIIPLDIDVVNGVDIGETLVDGPGIENCIVNELTGFKIIPKDKYGNIVPLGEDEFDVIVDGPLNPRVSVIPKDDGSYLVEYTPKKAEVHKVTILVNNIPLINSPYNVVVSNGLDVDKTIVSGGGSKKCYKDIPAIMNIKLFDKDGNKHPSGEDVEIEVMGPDNTPIKGVTNVDDDGYGNYIGTYVPDKVGPHVVQIKVNGHKLKPINLECKNINELPKPSKCFIKQKPMKLKLNELNTFQIQCVDKNGKPISTGGDDVEVEIEGPDDAKVKVIDCGNGKYNITLLPTKIGIYKMKPRVLNTQIKDGDFEVETDGPSISNSKRSHIIEWGLKIYAPTKKEEDFEIEIFTKKERMIPQIMKDELKNKFIIPITPNIDYKNEEHIINIKLQNQHIKGSPFKQTF